MASIDVLEFRHRWRLEFDLSRSPLDDALIFTAAATALRGHGVRFEAAAAILHDLAVQVGLDVPSALGTHPSIEDRQAILASAYFAIDSAKYCEICGCEPCRTPGFCDRCRADDKERKRAARESRSAHTAQIDTAKLNSPIEKVPQVTLEAAEYLFAQNRNRFSAWLDQHSEQAQDKILKHLEARRRVWQTTKMT